MCCRAPSALEKPSPSSAVAPFGKTLSQVAVSSRPPSVRDTSMVVTRATKCPFGSAIA